MTGYLLVPRPKDLVKAVVLPLAFAVGAVATGGVGPGQVLRAVLVWVALELLVYQARYQWNDARGFYADQAHPDAVSRGRLPGPVDKARPHLIANGLVAALRLALTAGLALAVPEVRGVLLGMTVGVFGVAFVYERLRSAATGRTSQVPVPLRAPLVGLWVAVGMGYAVRGMTGLALAVDLGGRPGLVVAGVAAMWALGVVFVTCRWALEAMCFGAIRDGRLVWEVRPDQAREHTLGLVRWLPAEVSDGETSPCAWRALQGRTPLTAPWHLALAVAGGTTALVGRLLVGSEGPVAGLVVVVLGAVLALVVAAVPGVRLVAATAAALLLGAAGMMTGVERPWVSVLPWVVALALYGCFTRQCADEIGHPLRRLSRA